MKENVLNEQDEPIIVLPEKYYRFAQKVLLFCLKSTIIFSES